MDYIGGWLKNNKSVEESQKQILQEKENLDRNITKEVEALKSKLMVKSELEECLDNIVTDRYRFKEEIHTKRNTLTSIYEPVKFDVLGDSPQPVHSKSKQKLSRSSSTSQSTGLLQSFASRKSRLLSLSDT